MKTKTQNRKNTDACLADYIENPRNPQTITDAKFDILVERLRKRPKMLAVRPIAYYVESGLKIVLGGNKRLRALKQIHGEAGHVPAEWFKDVSEMTAEERHDFVIDDNQQMGEYDLDKLLADYSVEELTEYGLDDLVEEMQKGGAESEDESAKVKDFDFDRISVVVECDDEPSAQELFNRLTEEGYQCKVSTL